MTTRSPTCWRRTAGATKRRCDEAKKRAPRAIKSRCRAVTAEDFEYLAMQAATIKRAKALPLFHPDFPGVKVPGVVTVIVVPDGDGPAPTPSEGTLRTVCAYLDQRRLLTTELYVIKPTYQRVEIHADVIVDDNADLAEVKTGVEQTIKDYFHPLKGGEDGQGWPFGGTIYYSRVNQRVFTVPGVQSITHARHCARRRRDAVLQRCDDQRSRTALLDRPANSGALQL